MAAVLAGGAGAVLSHWSAATLHGLRSGTGPRSHVTIRRKRRGSRPIAFHAAAIADDERTMVDGIPATTQARTLLDLAILVPGPSLARLVARSGPEAGATLADLLERYPHRRGAPKLRAVAAAPVPFTRSDLEARFLALVAGWGLPRPVANAVIEGNEVDCVWWAERVIVELDVYATQGDPLAFERDRVRDRALQAAGWTVVRITARQLDEEPHRVRADLERLLRR